MTDDRVGDVLRLVRGLADVSAGFVTSHGLSPAMAREVTRITLARYTLDALSALRAHTLDGRRVQVRLARSVPTAPLRALALPWLAGASRVTVHAPEMHRAFTARVAEGLGMFLGEDSAADHVIAYGSDETVAAVRAGLSAGVGFEGHGHGLGVGVVTADADPSRAGEDLARDVALYDQRGCLSPLAVLVRGDGARVAEAMHQALTAYEAALPRGPLDVGEAARVMQWQGVQSAVSERVWRGATHFVAHVTGPARVASPGARNIAVISLRDDAALRAQLDALAPWVTVVGLAGAWPEGERPAAFRGRVAPAGTMQDPPLDGPEDPRG